MIGPAVDGQIREHLTEDGCELEAMAGQSGCEIHVIGAWVTIDHKVPIFTHGVHARGVMVQLMSCSKPLPSFCATTCLEQDIS